MNFWHIAVIGMTLVWVGSSAVESYIYQRPFLDCVLSVSLCGGRP